MRPQQYWEAAQRLCVTIRDLAVGGNALPSWVELKLHKRRPYKKQGEE